MLYLKSLKKNKKFVSTNLNRKLESMLGLLKIDCFNSVIVVETLYCKKYRTAYITM